MALTEILARREVNRIEIQNICDRVLRCLKDDLPVGLRTRDDEHVIGFRLGHKTGYMVSIYVESVKERI